MRPDEKLTFFEGVCLFTLTFLYHLFNDFFASLTSETGTSGWISHSISAVLSLGLLGLFMLLYKRYKGMDLPEMVDAIYGKYVGKLMLGVLFVYLICYASVCLYQLVSFMQTYAYSTRSPLINGLVVMAVVGLFARYSIKGFARAVSFFLPCIVAAWLFILVLSYNQYDPDLLNPIMGYGVMTTVGAGFQLVSEFSGILILAIFGHAFGSEKVYKKTAMTAIAVAAPVLIITTLCYNMATPYSSISESSSGVMGMAQNTYISRFVQKTESVFIAVVITAILLLLAVSFLGAQKLYCHMFTIKKAHTSALVVPMGLLVVCVLRTMLTGFQFEYRLSTIIRKGSVYICVGFILLSLIVSLLRRHGKQGMIRTASLLLVCCLSMGLFSGCFGSANEPDSSIYPIVVGVDKGTKEKYAVTMKFMALVEDDGNGGDSSGGDEGNSEEDLPAGLMVFEGPTLSEGINMMISLLPKDVSFLQIKMLIISEELAREGIYEFINQIAKFNEIKPTMAIMISRCSAYELMSAEGSHMTSSLPMDIELVLEPKKSTTLYITQSLAEFRKASMTTYGDAMGMYGNLNQNEYKDKQEKGESPVERIGHTNSSFEEGYLPGDLPLVGNSKMEFAGVSLFDGDRMVGALNTKECQTLNFVGDYFHSTVMTVPDMMDPEEYYIELNMRKTVFSSYKTWMEDDGTMHISIFVPVDVTIKSFQNPAAEYYENQEQQEDLTLYLEEMMEKRSYQLFDKLQKCNSDVLQLGRVAARNFFTIPEWEEYNWSEKFADAVIHVEYDIHF